MRKRVITPAEGPLPGSDEDWLQLDQLAEVEITSENPAHPIEAALLPGDVSGWWAAGPGAQIIRFLFARPQPLRRIWLAFKETDVERTQEYRLSWSPDGGRSFREIVRQQWNFSPQGATDQTQDHRVDLPAVTVLELAITPDTRGGPAVATLAQFRLA